jgi:hypothetical protein
MGIGGIPVHVSERVFAHELDAAWIIALWKAIHGGDPAPEVVAAQVIAALAPYLTGAQPSLSFSELESQFKNFGIHIIDRTEEDSLDPAAFDSAEKPMSRRTRQYCFQFGRQTVCAQLPEISHRESAA